MARRTAQPDTASSAPSPAWGDGVGPGHEQWNTGGACCYCRDAPSSQAIAPEDIRRGGGEACVIRLDLGAAGSIRAAADDPVSRWGGIDVLVNSAVAWVPIRDANPGPFERTPDEGWRPLLRGNIEGTYVAVQRVVASMRPAPRGRECGSPR